ncbi:MAG: protein-glutamate O-methyltransferase CheR [Rickettsiales bacterium]|nr:protein-glutamate O-methyltransferase CheR [Rickettsiales bacterium]
MSTLLKKRSGLDLREDKTYLIESRLLPVARSLKLNDVAALCDHIRRTPSEALLVEVTEAMTTNESSFFRDLKPYEQLKQVILPELMQKQAIRKSLRIWSAACSTGQEPYSIAISIEEEKAKFAGWKVDIIATDLAKKVVDKAKGGIYTQFEAQRGLPIQMLLKYFTSLPDTSWQVKDHIRQAVQFKLQNLLEDYSTLGQFDLIFCRNVLIYFDEDTKAGVTERMARSLAPHGLLVLGATETLIDRGGKFVASPDLRGVYRLKA